MTTHVAWEIVCWTALVAGLGAMWLARRWMQRASASLEKAAATYREAHAQALDASHLYTVAEDLCVGKPAPPRHGTEQGEQ